MNTAKTAFVAFGTSAVVIMTVLIAGLNSRSSQLAQNPEPQVLGLSVTRTADPLLINVAVNDRSGFSLTQRELDRMRLPVPEDSAFAEYYDGMVLLDTLKQEYDVSSGLMTLTAANGTDYVLGTAELTDASYVILYNDTHASLNIIQQGELSDIALVELITDISVDLLP